MLSLPKHLAEGALSIWATRPSRLDPGSQISHPHQNDQQILLA